MSGSIGFYCLGWGLFLEEEGFNVGGFGFFRVDYLEIHSHKKCDLWEQLFELPKESFTDFEPLYKRVATLFGILNEE